MQFIFDGTLDALKETIQVKAKEHGKDIILYHNEPNTLEIGFQRLGHNGGRFFVANITEENDTVILSGEAKDIDSEQSQNKMKRVVDTIGSWLFIYMLFAFIPLLVWIFIFHLNYIWIPLVLPIPIIIFCRMNAKKQDQKTDTEFIEFMSLFTTYTDSALESYTPSWDSTYKKLDLAGGKFQSFCDDSEDMLLITYKDGMQIDVGYVADEKIYYITIVSSDTVESWKHPLGVFATKDKSQVSTELQKAIYKFRKI